jgi:hypothetical protein
MSPPTRSGRLSLARQANFQTTLVRRRPSLFRQSAAVEQKRNAGRVMRGEKPVERRIEQRLKMAAQARFEKAGVEQGRKRVLQFKAHRRPAFGRQPGRRHPLPRRPMARGQPPRGRHVALAAARLRHDLFANQQAELDADAGEADALPARLRARGDVVVARELPALHPRAVVDRRQRARRRIGLEADLRRARVESFGYDFR